MLPYPTPPKSRAGLQHTPCGTIRLQEAGRPLQMLAYIIPLSMHRAGDLKGGPEVPLCFVPT
jgi:hypothetical protein